MFEKYKLLYSYFKLVQLRRAKELHWETSLLS